MHTGGAEQNEGTIQAIQLVSLIVSPIITVHAALIIFGFVSSENYSSAWVAAVLGLLWPILCAYYYFNQVKSSLNLIVRLVILHSLALLLFVSVTGFAQPLTSVYVLLFIASYLYFGKKGLLVSTAALIFAASVDALAKYTIEQQALLANGISVFWAIILGYCVVWVLSSQETKRQALIHSQLRERLQYDRIMTIMNNLTDAAFSTDKNGVISLYNAACLDLLDTNDSLKGKNISSLFNLTDQDKKTIKFGEILRSATRATRRDDLTHSYTDGESIRLEITFAPIRSGYSLNKRNNDQGGYIVIMRDITKQKSLEEERDEFISVVSHELRTPITIVEGTLSNLEVLANQPKPPRKNVLIDSLATAHDQIIYLARMVNDLSTLSRAERGTADTAEAINLEELVHDMYNQYEKEASQKGLHLNLDLEPKLGVANVSRLYLEELLQNFITNAIKYTKQGSVTISAKRTNNTVRLEVSDTGIGISRSDQNKVFNKFYRSEDYRIRETGGTGLGLYVSTKLAHKLHTKIELKSRLNHGSTFSFELPVE